MGTEGLTTTVTFEEKTGKEEVALGKYLGKWKNEEIISE
jgi:hypothetical protein